MSNSNWLVAAAFTAIFATSAQAAPLYVQDFETNTVDWSAGVTQVPSGTGGITSSGGSFHATAASGSFTQWGGYNTSIGGVLGPFQPYTTSIDIFLDVGGGAANDTRFDFTSAINNAAGTHLSDFAFNVGFYNSADNTGPGAGANRFVVSASNNTGRANSFPKNPGRDPIAILVSGWYTFAFEFLDNGGVLSVLMSILDSSNALIGDWTLGGNPIAGVGGNRYGWFPNNEFGPLAIDNASLSSVAAVPLPAALPLFGAGVAALGMGGWIRRRKRTVA